MELRQERDFGQKINATFQFAAENWRAMLNSLLVLVLPLSMIQGVVSALQQASLQRSIRENAADIPDLKPGDIEGIIQLYSKMFSSMASSQYVIIGALVGVLAQVLLAMTINAFMLAYIEQKEDSANWSFKKTNAPDITLEQVLNIIKKHFVAVFFSRFVIILALILSLIAFVFPFFYFVLPLSVFPTIIIMAEDKGIFESISRSVSLISGKWWSTFGLLLVIGICYSLMSLIFTIPVGLMSLTEAGNSETSLAYITVMAIATGLSSLLLSLIYIATNFQYFNLVERKEGASLFKPSNPSQANTPEREEEY